MFGWFSGKAALTPQSRIQPTFSRTTSTDSGQQEATPEKPATTTPVPLLQPRPLTSNREVSQTKGATKLEDVGAIGQAEFERIVASFPPDGPVRMSLTTDPMDDAQVIIFSLNAISHQGDADVVPSLNIRARRKGITTVLEDFYFLGERYLFRRGPDPNVHLRWDSHEARAIQF